METSRLFSPGPGLERYRVRGGGLVALEVAEGDDVSIVDVEGRQSCEVFVFGPDGRPDPEAAGLDAEVLSESLAKLAGSEDEDARRLAAALAARGIALGPARAARMLAGDGRPGQTAA